MVIEDQRTMTGRQRHATVSEVEAAWARRALKPFRERDFQPGLVDLTAGPPLSAYVNLGRWVADCPLCLGGIAGWPENPRGACLSCGRIYLLTYPSADLISEAEVLLADRARHNRNWYPDRESVAQLRAENLIRGPVESVLAAYEALVDSLPRTVT